jgi:uncharacterized protein
MEARMSKHHIVHVEISALDREASGKFYAELFDWEVQQMPEMEYATFETGEGVGGGFNPVREGYPAGTITFYVETDDVDATLAKAEALGGRILATRTEIPGVGWFGMFADPSGNMIGLLDPIPPPS